jgi:hypothetical protein
VADSTQVPHSDQQELSTPARVFVAWCLCKSAPGASLLPCCSLAALQAAVLSAGVHSTLEPHCLYMGDTGAPIYQWLTDQGVQMVTQVPKWREDLVNRASKRVGQGQVRGSTHQGASHLVSRADHSTAHALPSEAMRGQGSTLRQSVHVLKIADNLGALLGCAGAGTPPAPLLTCTACLALYGAQNNTFYSPLYKSPDLLVSTFQRLDIAIAPELTQ